MSGVARVAADEFTGIEGDKGVEGVEVVPD